MTKRLPRSDGGNNESNIEIPADSRKVVPIPPIPRERNRIGNDDPVMNMTQLKKYTTMAVATIIQHFTCPAKNRVRGVPSAAPKLQLEKSRATSAVEKKAPVMRW
jgi:hypothetical protein